jgi:hypothetical protein
MGTEAAGSWGNHGVPHAGRSRRRGSTQGFCVRGRAFPAALHQHRDPDRQLVQDEQRRDLERERDGVDGREEDREDEHQDVPHAAVAAQASRREHPEPDEREHEDRHLEGDPEREQRERDEREVVARPDLRRVEVGVVVDEERQRLREDDDVAERHPGGEERGREHDEHAEHTLRVLPHRRREERPDLPQQDRQDERDRRVEADLERREERLGDTERDEGRPRREQVLEPLDQVVVERVRERERRDDRAEADEQAVPELREVLDETRLLVVAEAPRQHAGHRAAGRLGNGVALARRRGGRGRLHGGQLGHVVDAVVVLA